MKLKFWSPLPIGAEYKKVLFPRDFILFVHSWAHTRHDRGPLSPSMSSTHVTLPIPYPAFTQLIFPASGGVVGFLGGRQGKQKAFYENKAFLIIVSDSTTKTNN